MKQEEQAPLHDGEGVKVELVRAMAEQLGEMAREQTKYLKRRREYIEYLKDDFPDHAATLQSEINHLVLEIAHWGLTNDLAKGIRCNRS